MTSSIHFSVHVQLIEGLSQRELTCVPHLFDLFVLHNKLIGSRSTYDQDHSSVVMDFPARASRSVARLRDQCTAAPVDIGLEESTCNELDDGIVRVGLDTAASHYLRDPSMSPSGPRYFRRQFSSIAVRSMGSHTSHTSHIALAVLLFRTDDQIISIMVQGSGGKVPLTATYSSCTTIACFDGYSDGSLEHSPSRADHEKSQPRSPGIRGERFHIQTQARQRGNPPCFRGSWSYGSHEDPSALHRSRPTCRSVNCEPQQQTMAQ